MPPVSFYVPCYNGEATIGRCLESLLALDDPPDDITVIDDGSLDRTAEIVRRYPRVRLARQGVNKGLAAARNRGLREARHGLVASVDADVVVGRSWMGALLRVAAEYPEASGFGGRMLETIAHSLGDRWRGVHLRQDWGAERIVGPRFLFGSNTLMRRDHLLAIGGYDERLRTNGEDVNLAFRLGQSGRYLVFDPAPVCRHLRGDTLSGALRMHWMWKRSPYSVLFPPRNLRQLAGFIWRRTIIEGWRCMREDWCARRYGLLPVGFLAMADGARREIIAFAKSDSSR